MPARANVWQAAHAARACDCGTVLWCRTTLLWVETQPTSRSRLQSIEAVGYAWWCSPLWSPTRVDQQCEGAQTDWSHASRAACVASECEANYLFRLQIGQCGHTSSAAVKYIGLMHAFQPVVLFSQLNQLSSGYFDPIDIVFHYTNSQFSGWPNWYISSNRNTGYGTLTMFTTRVLCTNVVDKSAPRSRSRSMWRLCMYTLKRLVRICCGAWAMIEHIVCAQGLALDPRKTLTRRCMAYAKESVLRAFIDID